MQWSDPLRDIQYTIKSALLIGLIHLRKHEENLHIQQLKWSKFQRIPPSHTNNHLPWIISLYIFPTRIIFLSSCTSSGSILQLCKVTSILLHTLRRSCAYDKYGEMDRWAGWFQYTPPPPKKKCLLRGIIRCVWDYLLEIYSSLHWTYQRKQNM